ncbi:RNA-binding S4 domain-containing protein [Pengzhenrongella sp.]|jgi:ribosome-associated protein|uniref:RNA-binding S4 domain-containing protein n=1 Tax=Pengzhenrongella sp. TaxID=2888820 RepID=UPI002F93A774
MSDAPITTVPITGDVIRLGQFLKLAGLAESGAHARELIADETVTVNGEAEARRGRQLHRGDLVELDTANGLLRAAVG